MIILKQIINNQLVVSINENTKIVFDMVDGELYHNGEKLIPGSTLSKLLSDNYIDVSKYSKSLRQSISDSIASIKDSLRSIALSKSLSEIEEGWPWLPTQLNYYYR